MTLKRFNARFVETARVTGGKRLVVRDTDARGLELRVTPSGAKSWGFRYRRLSELASQGVV